MRAPFVLVIAALSLTSACGVSGGGAGPVETLETSPSPSSAGPLASKGEGGLSASAAPAPEVDSALALGEAEATPEPGACPAEMVLVQGNYCLSPEHRCVDPPEGPGSKPGVNHCLRYAEPSTCYADRRRPMRFCMDRYEWPNQKGALPMVLVSWEDARQICGSVGKRLCNEDEFNFACEGEAIRPYVYGYERDTSRCNFDKPYRKRTFTFLPWGFCLADPDCLEAFEAIDQRMPSGAMETCRSDAGAFDLNGNVNEWVVISNAKAPHRSGLKGGWWGPVRNRCRPTVTFHDEGDFGYEVGFRCCADPPSPQP